MNTHLNLGTGVTACGISSQTGGLLRQSSHPAAVNCPECRATEQFARTPQRIPNVPVPVYRHV